jgi:hypothetical protein
MKIDITGTLNEDRHTFLTKSRSFLLRMTNVSDKSFIRNRFSNFLSKTVPFMRIEEFSRVGQATDSSTIRHMRISRYVTKATNTH